MSELRKANTDYPYFITLTVAGWIVIFTRKCYCDVIIDSWKYCMERKGLEIFAYVIMPSHIHMVARSLNGDLNKILRDSKSFTSKKILGMIEQMPGESRGEWLLHMFKYFAKYQKQNETYSFWQKTNHPIELNYPEIIDHKIEYIHNNPVEAGYVINPESWYYSSACSVSPLKVLET
jgi:REP element-mobilizing transposase RayT